mgnify:CR=1 FL=1
MPAQLFSTNVRRWFTSRCGYCGAYYRALYQKQADGPAVISVDERGSFVIPLLAGHIGGANELSRCLAAALGATACVTTATDVNGLFAVDEWAARNRMVLCSLAAAKDFAAAPGG